MRVLTRASSISKLYFSFATSRVFGPKQPSASRPSSCWNFLTASAVASPYSLSKIKSFPWPLPQRKDCTNATFVPMEPFSIYCGIFIKSLLLTNIPSSSFAASSTLQTLDFMDCNIFDSCLRFLYIITWRPWDVLLSFYRKFSKIGFLEYQFFGVSKMAIINRFISNNESWTWNFGCSARQTRNLIGGVSSIRWQSNSRSLTTQCAKITSFIK